VWVKPHRRLNRAAPRADLHRLVRLDAEARRVLGMEIDGLTTTQRRLVEAGLNSRVVGVEAPACGQPDRELVVQLVDWGLPRCDGEWCSPTLDGSLPQASMQEQRAGMVLARARPLDSAQLL